MFSAGGKSRAGGANSCGCVWSGAARNFGEGDKMGRIAGFTGTGYDLHNFATRGRRRTFSTGVAPPLSVTRRAVELMEA